MLKSIAFLEPLTASGGAPLYKKGEHFFYFIAGDS